MDVKQLGAYVRAERLARGMTGRQLAKYLKIDPAILCRFEKGARTPRLDKLKTICDYFQLEIEEIDLYKNVNFEPVKIIYQKKPKEELIVQCDKCLARKKIWV